ncbi:MAG: hypothetical protein CM1200mP24_07550 [Gammaproteobacteria bacterium]|jgi:osmoprotectant transport system ATP-binding protein|nr:ATP-binding cassette domain-containing protein [Pseudomonadales bacterium]GIS97471.1 MAG: hypothetical protein CM1200mP24_07550 [Gammaproteobacteria bacterium]HAO54297.1 ABC transporter ATP-binding protein [Gammaproteobacteria bacterium]|tara:strand:- start:202 stop:927 length:726 start_codon:yes stop_codon:yes gene_type:complete
MGDCVTFKEVGKCFGDQWVFRHVSLTLPESEVTAIVGASGSGKTTLLQLVNGVYTPDEGAVSVMGKPIPEDLTSFRKRIGYAVQGVGLFPHMTVFQNVSLLARLQGWNKQEIDTRSVELMNRMELSTELLHRYPYQLSGGQQQRVGLCRALMLRPQMLLLDEPFSAIDPITRADLHAHFAALQLHEGVSTLLVTHDLREAVKLAGFLVIMADGQIVQSGKTTEVLDAPANSYVRQLLDTQL